MSLEPADWSLVAALGANLRYIEELEARYAADPKSVDPALAALLRGAVLPGPAMSATPKSGGGCCGGARRSMPDAAAGTKGTGACCG